MSAKSRQKKRMRQKRKAKKELAKRTKHLEAQEKAEKANPAPKAPEPDKEQGGISIELSEDSLNVGDTISLGDVPVEGTLELEIQFPKVEEAPEDK